MNICEWCGIDLQEDEEWEVFMTSTSYILCEDCVEQVEEDHE